LGGIGVAIQRSVNLLLDTRFKCPYAPLEQVSFVCVRDLVHPAKPTEEARPETSDVRHKALVVHAFSLNAPSASQAWRPQAKIGDFVSLKLGAIARDAWRYCAGTELGIASRFIGSVAYDPDAPGIFTRYQVA
jgi:hypothetical protein